MNILLNDAHLTYILGKALNAIILHYYWGWKGAFSFFLLPPQGTYQVVSGRNPSLESDDKAPNRRTDGQTDRQKVYWELVMCK